jgi:sporulation protein YlmC with PRC-barrel domain
MTPDSAIKLVSELLDLPLLDTEGVYCGIVDDVELEGGPGRGLKLKALLVGPGAYSGRMPRWQMWLLQKVVGNRLTRVPMEQIRSIGSVVHLEQSGRDLGLQKGEAAAGRWIPRWGAF